MMGRAPSSFTTHTLSALKRFNTFDEFSEDHSAADALISKEAINALKYVNSNFVSRFGGDRKWKLINNDETRMVDHFITPT